MLTPLNSVSIWSTRQTRRSRIMSAAEGERTKRRDAASTLLGVRLGCGSFDHAWVALALFASDVLGSLFTGQPMLRTGLRHVGFGLAAAAVTFVLGELVGAGLAL